MADHGAGGFGLIHEKLDSVVMHVPAWFAELGYDADTRIADRWGVPAETVRHVRYALNVPAFRPRKTKFEKEDRLERFERLRRNHVPKKLWAKSLGFEDLPYCGLTANDCLEDWIYCLKNNLEYVSDIPRKPKIRKKFEAKIRKRTLRPRTRSAPERVPLTPSVSEKEDESFSPGDY